MLIALQEEASVYQVLVNILMTLMHFSKTNQLLSVNSLWEKISEVFQGLIMAKLLSRDYITLILIRK